MPIGIDLQWRLCHLTMVIETIGSCEDIVALPHATATSRFNISIATPAALHMLAIHSRMNKYHTAPKIHIFHGGPSGANKFSDALSNSELPDCATLCHFPIV